METFIAIIVLVVAPVVALLLLELEVDTEADEAFVTITGAPKLSFGARNRSARGR